jgi:hypothetical protein
VSAAVLALTLACGCALGHAEQAQTAAWPARPRAAAPASAPATRRGPLDVRETWLLAQPRLTLPPVAPDVLPAGASVWRLEGDWGNDFGWNQQAAGEQPAGRRFLVDGEHRTGAIALRRGVGSRWDLEARLPIQWRGAGFLDHVIDAFHGFTRKLGLPDNERGRFERDRLRVLGQRQDGQPLAWSGGPGTALGRLELSSRVRLGAPAPHGWTWALVPRVTLPTGTGTFGAPGLEAGLQLAAARPLGARWDVFTGVGATAGRRDWQGLRYRRARVHGFAALEWRPARRVSLLAQVDAASRLVTDIAAYPGLQSYLRLGASFDVDARVTLSAGFTENISDQQATTDFGVFAGLSLRLARGR